MTREIRPKRQPSRPPTAHRRERTVRVAADVARRVADGHPWVFGDALRGRQVSATAGDCFDLVDPDGLLVARAVYDPDSSVAFRVFSRRAGTSFDGQHVAGAVRAAAKWRRQLLDLGADECLRVLSGDSEGVPAVNVDRYGPYLVISSYSAIADAVADSLVATLVEAWRPAAVYWQRRQTPAASGRARSGGELVYGQAAPAEVVVREGRVRYAVDVTAPMGTGLFIDMRAGRAAVGRLAAGKRVLNCFSYAGAFSVVAAVHGASRVVSVDAASRAHTRARRNLALNGFELAESERFEFVTGDAVAALTRLAARNQHFDLVVLDPPTFSAAKGRTFTALRDYADLAGAAVRTLAPGGFLCAASNATKLPWDDLERAVGRGVAQCGRQGLVVQRVGQPADFPAAPTFVEGRYLKCSVVRVL